MLVLSISSPKVAKKTIKLDVYGTTDSYATNVKNAQRVIYTGRYLFEECL
jgi:hypothetical protein